MSFSSSSKENGRMLREATLAVLQKCVLMSVGAKLFKIEPSSSPDFHAVIQCMPMGNCQHASKFVSFDLYISSNFIVYCIIHLHQFIEAYPKATAVLVRNHGIYVWGDSWISAKTQAECYHYLFEAAIKLHQLGLDWSTPSHGPIARVKKSFDTDRDINCISQRCIVLDIEGTTTPISFVTEVLFPYARDNVGNHLNSTYDTEETREDIKLIRAQVEEDIKQGITGSVPVPPDNAGKEEVIASLVANVYEMIKADRKITALKQLQGHIWRTGYERNELKGVVFEDVPKALEKWHALGKKMYIYSSGSREAQRLIFGNTNYGDLRKYLSGFFDTTIGNKREARSYFEISQSVGVDKPSEILFLTDVYQEAVAAKAAGLMTCVASLRSWWTRRRNVLRGFSTV
ncbi:hypothetical protein ACHQM5_012261 [Ranunculus cassubicifolius]